MKVLIVMTAREVGGAEHYVLRLVHTLREQCDFTVVLANHPKLKRMHESLGQWSTIVSCDFDQPLALLKLTRTLQKLAREHHVVHINSNHPASRLGIWATWALSNTSIPVICVEQRATPVADIHVPKYLAGILPKLFYWSRTKVARTVAVSQENAQTLTQLYGLPASSIQVIYNSADVNQLRKQITEKPSTLRQELGLDPSSLIVTTMARLSPNKGHRYLIEAVPLIVTQYPNVHFVFAGQIEVASIEALITQHPFKQHFSLLGYREDIANLWGASDVAVLPSLGEGFALSIVDALACGVPVVATQVGGAAEVIRNGENGWLVPPANAQALAKAIITILASSNTVRQQYREQAIQSAQAFSVEEMGAKMLALYRTVSQKI